MLINITNKNQGLDLQNDNLTKAEAIVALDKVLRLKDLSDEIISLKG